MKLAITGFSRYGTTALTDLLNLDPRIKITYEKGSFLSRGKNSRRKWNDRNRALKAMDKTPIYTGDKCTRPYLEQFGKIQEKTDKIIFCLRDPRDIFRSRYWKLIDVDPVQEYIRLMNIVLQHDLKNVLFIMYEWAVVDVELQSEIISHYLGLDSPINITGHNYKPVRRFCWKKSEKIDLPEPVYQIISRFGYENTDLW